MRRSADDRHRDASAERRSFGSKDDLILEVVLRQIRSDTERLPARLTLEGPARDLIVDAMLVGLDSRRNEVTQLPVSEEMRAWAARAG